MMNLILLSVLDLLVTEIIVLIQVWTSIKDLVSLRHILAVYMLTAGRYSISPLGFLLQSAKCYEHQRTDSKIKLSFIKEIPKNKLNKLNKLNSDKRQRLSWNS